LENNIKETITALLQSVNREGIDRLISFLYQSDFFTAPCSTEYHLAVPGGLAEHSLNVYNVLKQKVQSYNLNIPGESLIICGLCHDLCKVNYYTTGKRNVKENGVWREKEVFMVKDQFPMGHGEKSVSILQDFIRLENFEKLAIRWHMTAFDPSIHFNYPNGYAFRAAAAQHPLVTLLFTADYEASNIIEAKVA
jgi:hypothetical protein